MPFKPGISGNLNGKPPGTKNKLGLDLREMINNFLEENFSVIQKDFNELKPRERVKVYCDLLQYSLPKYQSITSTINFEDLSEDQLDSIIEKIKKIAFPDDAGEPK